MLKKILSLALAIMMLLGTFTFAVSAAAPKVGDKLGDILYSDITAYINGNAIPTSIKSGTTMVVVEDLAKYGFDVVWNGKDKTLKVEINPNKKITPIAVAKNNNPVGTVKTQYVYTDIKTYLSGKQVESFAINGQTLIDFELLSKYGKLAWDGKARTISLMTDGYKLPSLTLEDIRKAAQDAGYAVNDDYYPLDEKLPQPVNGIVVEYTKEYATGGTAADVQVYEFKNKADADIYAKSLLDGDSFFDYRPVQNGRFVASITYYETGTFHQWCLDEIAVFEIIMQIGKAQG